ncbi:hypothetical protein C9J03_26130 [Photobacterium gaetbulicola]|uniref:Uncharacterized protein n=1 Tax=Photobacterium gaetbulicola Gung47 TaxID=658445 RepID=A0A0C4JN13_9GAMM|nr:hypothetical protein [Photobacterium gaetbulicola]AHA59172.1 hypothetical protein H744_p0015 [Photobacterium gaetbulicola Gung47]PST98686.1 hypothetical protein C9J03_26130 [Photobacterium gaetbulicola]
MSELEGLLAGTVGLVCLLWAYHAHKKNSEIAALKKQLDIISVPPKEKKTEAEPPAPKHPRRAQSPAVRQLLERTLEKDKPNPQPKSRIPSPWEIDIPEQSGASKPKKPHYDPNVWKEVGGKLVLKDKSDEASRRREASVKSAQATIPRRPVCLPPSSLVVHSDTRD